MAGYTVTMPGVFRAKVADNADPEGLGRLRLIIPSITGSHHTTWAWPIHPVVDPPDVGLGVFVMFENGDLSSPLWMGKFGGV